MKKNLKTKIKFKIDIYIALLVVLCIGVVISHIFYVFQTMQYPQHDEHAYMTFSVAFYRMFIANPGLDAIGEMYTYLISSPPFRQPLYPVTLMLPLFIFGLSQSYKIALFMNAIYYVMIICGIYLIGRNYFSKQASLLACFLFASYGFPLFYLHFTYSETSTTAWVILAIYILIRSRKFDSYKYAVIAGLVFSAALLTRWIAVFFVVGAAVPAFMYLFKNRPTKNYLKAVGLFLVGMLPSIIFYVATFEYFVRDYILINTDNASEWVVKYMGSTLYVNSLSPQSFAYYFKVFEQLNIFFFMLFLIGLIIAFIKWKKLYVLLLCFFIPYISLTVFSSLKDDRYIVPIYPIIALISVAFFDMLQVRLRKIIFSVLIIFTILSFLGGTWAIGPMGQEGLKSFLVHVPIGHPRRIHITSMVWPPIKRFSNADVVLNTIEKDSINSGIKNPRIVRLFYFPYFDNSYDSINTYLRKTTYYASNLVRPEIKFNNTECSDYIVEELKKADYVLVKDGQQVEDTGLPSVYYKYLKVAILAVEDSKYLDRLHVVKKTVMPFDKSVITIYKNTKEGRDTAVLQKAIETIGCSKFKFEKIKI